MSADGDAERTDSEISFCQQHKELQQLYQDFRRALSALTHDSDIGDDPREGEDAAPTSAVRLNYELCGIIRELESMRTETHELRAMLRRVKRRQRSQVQPVRAKINSLLRVIGHQIQHANSLLRTG
jgi:hypothetical protein